MVLAVFFKDQVSGDSMLLTLFALSAVLAIMLAFAGVVLIDMGVVRRKNLIDTGVQKLIAGMIAGVAFTPIGYGIWNWQFDAALGVPHPLGQAIKDWWIGGHFLTTVPQNIDPTILPFADQYVMFFVVFIVFAIFLGGVLQSAGLERMKPLSLYVLAFVAGAVVYPIALYLLWGSASPLTRIGVHDDIGGLGAYLPLAAMAFVIAWRVGPRRGRFDDVAGSSDTPGPRNLSFTVMGMLLVLAALPFFVIAGGYQSPGNGYFGIAFTTAGMGLAVTNWICAVMGGAIGGVILSYRTKSPFWAIAGPFTGYISVTTFNEIGAGWYEFFVGAASVYVAWGTVKLLTKLRIDDEKFTPLIGAPCIFGAIVGGFTEWGTKTGGFPGITEGAYAFQHGTVTPWYQLLGVAVAIGVGGGITLITCLILEKTIGLRVTEEQEVLGLDRTYWPAYHDYAMLDGLEAAAYRPALGNGGEPEHVPMSRA